MRRKVVPSIRALVPRIVSVHSRYKSQGVVLSTLGLPKCAMKTCFEWENSCPQ
jgi:hypothetical protein